MLRWLRRNNIISFKTLQKTPQAITLPQSRAESTLKNSPLFHSFIITKMYKFTAIYGLATG